MAAPVVAHPVERGIEMLAPNSSDVAGLLQQARALMPMRKRGANTALYDALEIAMRVCELCNRDIEQDILLGKMIAELPRGEKNRQYIERSSDVYQRVCRYVFLGEEHTANINRYAHALREAANQQVHSSELKRRLNNGGVNQFYLVRPLHSEVITTKCIRLAKQITHRKADTFTLQLRRLSDNSYEVIDFSQPEPQP